MQRSEGYGFQAQAGGTEGGLRGSTSQDYSRVAMFHSISIGWEYACRMGFSHPSHGHYVPFTPPPPSCTWLRSRPRDLR